MSVKKLKQNFPANISSGGADKRNAVAVFFSSSLTKLLSIPIMAEKKRMIQIKTAWIWFDILCIPTAKLIIISTVRANKKSVLKTCFDLYSSSRSLRTTADRRSSQPEDSFAIFFYLPEIICCYDNYPLLQLCLHQIIDQGFAAFVQIA